MHKHTYLMGVRPYIFMLVSFMLLSPTIVMASNKPLPNSVITVPIEVDLKVLENHLNTLVPNLLAEIEELNKVCVEAQYLKTKGIPKCRMDGYKISCKDRTIKIKTIPQINCDVRGWVKRDGRILLSGQGKTLHFTFPIKAQVSTEIGISGIAHASAVLHIQATPKINQDWSISLDITPHFVYPSNLQ
ncbi:MAG: DUF4403 family protein [Sulfurovum sp.]|nr:DUF4403 family protein [Sulfurovum sp.]